MIKFNLDTEAFFVAYDPDTRSFLLRLLAVLECIGYRCYLFECYVCYLGALLNVLHLIVLTRKSMMTSSINSIMIGIALCDLFTMFILIFVTPYQDDEDDDCVPPKTLFLLRVFTVTKFFRFNFRRCSAWLGVLMALVRYLIIKFIKNPKEYSTPRFGFIVSAGAFSASSFLSSFYFLQFENYFVEDWTIPIECQERFPPGTILPVYKKRLTEMFTMWDGFFTMFFTILDASVSKLAPCILLPILTVLLCLELRKSRKMCETSGSIATKRSDKTTVLVIVMAVFFIISEFPLVFATIVIAVCTKPGLIRIGDLVFYICNSIFTLNGTYHCIICLVMSTQYRETAVRMFRRKEYTSRTASNTGMGKLVAITKL